MAEYTYRGPGLPLILRKAAENFVDAIRATGLYQPDQPGQIFKFRLENPPEIVVIRIDCRSVAENPPLYPGGPPEG